MNTVTPRIDPTPTTTPFGPVAQNQQTGKVSQTPVPVGNGVTGQETTPPDVQSQTPGYISLAQALRTMLPKMTDQDFEVLLAQTTSALKESMGEVEESRANNEMETKRTQIHENQAKIEEAMKKLDEAEAKKKSGNIFDILDLVFQAIGAALLVAIGTVFTAFGAGAVGVPMIISGVMLAISMVNALTAKLNEGAGILGSIVKAAGGSGEAVAGADGAFAGAMLIAGIALAVFTGGKTLETGIKDMTAATVKAISIATQAGTSATSAAMQIGSSAFKLDASLDSAAAKKSRAESNEIQALMETLDDLIDMAMQLLMQVKQNASSMMDAYTEMLTETGNTLSNTRFAG